MIAKAAFCRSSATHMPPPADEKSEEVEPPSCFPGALPRPWGHPEPRGGAARRRQTGRYPVRRLSCARCGEAVEGSSPLPGTRTGDTAPGAQPSGNFLPSACGARISSPSLKRFKPPLRTLRSRSVRLIPPASDSPAPDLFAFRGKGMQAPSASMVAAMRKRPPVKRLTRNTEASRKDLLSALRLVWIGACRGTIGIAMLWHGSFSCSRGGS